MESLEDRKLMAIVWANPADVSIDQYYGSNANTARAIVERAVADWNSAITSFNYIEDSDGNPNNNLNDTFQLSVVAQPLLPGERGVVLFDDVTYNSTGTPTSAVVRIDDNGAGAAAWTCRHSSAAR
jgi:hypothetical protein